MVNFFTVVLLVLAVVVPERTTASPTTKERGRARTWIWDLFSGWPAFVGDRTRNNVRFPTDVASWENEDRYLQESGGVEDKSQWDSDEDDNDGRVDVGSGEGSGEGSAESQTTAAPLSTTTRHLGQVLPTFFQLVNGWAAGFNSNSQFRIDRQEGVNVLGLPWGRQQGVSVDLLRGFRFGKRDHYGPASMTDTFQLDGDVIHGFAGWIKRISDLAQHTFRHKTTNSSR